MGFIEDTGHAHGVADPIQMTVATTDGTSIWAFRYSSEGRVPFAVPQHERRDAPRDVPGQPRPAQVSDETRLIVSEPLGDLPGAWREVPESSCGVVQPGQDELRPFAPVHR